MKIDVRSRKLSNLCYKKICVISDIHFCGKKDIKKLNMIYNKIKQNSPDFICIPGDLIDHSEHIFTNKLEDLYDFIGLLGEICPVVISLGNHDLGKDSHYKDAFINRLEYINNIFVLDNSDISFDDVRFIGYTQEYDTYRSETKYRERIIDDINRLLVNIDETKYNILLAHNPIYLVKDYVANNIVRLNRIKIILSGHNHGGFTPNFLHSNTCLISPCKRLLLKNGRGLVVKGNTNVFISSGVTKLSDSSKLLKYFNGIYPISIDFIEI